MTEVRFEVPTVAVIPLPGKVSGQNIINALRRAVQEPKEADLKWQQHGKRTSRVFHLHRRRPTSSFRRRRNMPTAKWSTVHDTWMMVVCETAEVIPDRFYKGVFWLNLYCHDNPGDTSDLELFQKVARRVPDQLKKLAV